MSISGDVQYIGGCEVTNSWIRNHLIRNTKCTFAIRKFLPVLSAGTCHKSRGLQYLVKAIA